MFSSKRILPMVATIAFAWQGAANANLVVDFYGVPGSGQTTIIFSGSSIATSNNFFRVPGSASNSNMWQNIGAFTAIQDQNRSFASGSASISVNAGGPVSISTVYFDDDGGTGDDWTVGLASQTNFSSGDTVSWDGLVTGNYDIGSLFNVSIPAQFTGSNFAGLELELNVFDTAAVPEPTSFAMFGMACLVGLNRRRRRAG